MSRYPRSRILLSKLIPADLRRRFNAAFEFLERQVDPSLTRTALSDLNDEDLPNATTKYVKGVGYFYLDRTSTATVDGVSVLSTDSGVGRWISDTSTNPYNPIRWKDILGDITAGAGAAALTYEAYRDTSHKMYFWRSNQDDELNFRYQINHDWIPGTQVHPHLHVIPMAPGSGDVIVDGHYAWAIPNVETPALTGWTTFYVTTSFTAADQYKEKFISLPYITPPVNAKESAILMIFMRRPGASDVNDTYDTAKPAPGTASANLGLLSADLHYQAEKVGTIPEFPT